SRLLDPVKRRALDAENRTAQAELRERHAERVARPLTPLTAARARGPKLTFRAEELPAPAFIGRRVVADVPLAEAARYIGWTFFFAAWELTGKYPAILDDPRHGEAARDLYAAGTRMLEKIVGEHRLSARGVYGFWPAAADGDDIVLYADAERARELTRFPML